MSNFNETVRSELAAVQTRIVNLSADLRKQKDQEQALLRYLGQVTPKAPKAPKASGAPGEGTVQQAVMDALADGPKTYAEIVAQTGKPNNQVSSYLWALSKSGRVQKVGNKRWALAEQPALTVVGGAS